MRKNSSHVKIYNLLQRKNVTEGTGNFNLEMMDTRIIQSCETLNLEKSFCGDKYFISGEINLTDVDSKSEDFVTYNSDTDNVDADDDGSCSNYSNDSSDNRDCHENNMTGIA